MRTERTSSLPLLTTCAQSGADGDIRIDSHNPAAALGTAAHQGMERYAKGLPVDAEALASLYSVDANELDMLISMGIKAYVTLVPKDVQAFAESDLSASLTPELTLTGHPDLHWASDPSGVEGIDWKFGRKDSSYAQQALGYCALTLVAYKAVRATWRIVWVRTQEVEVYSMARADLAAWTDRTIASVADQAYRPGDHCGYCRRKLSCEARLQLEQHAVAVLSNPGTLAEAALRDLAPTRLIELRRQAKMVAKLAEDVDSAIRGEVARRGGSVEGDGARLAFTEVEKRKLDPLKAWPVLEQRLSDGELAECVKVSVSDAEKAVAAKAPRGQGAASKRELAQALEEAGAVSRVTEKRLEERRS